MTRIFIDDKEYEVDSKQNLLHAALSLKLDLPYFCCGCLPSVCGRAVQR